MKPFSISHWALSVALFTGLCVALPPPGSRAVARVVASAEAQPNQLDTVRRVRAKYPTPLGASHWVFLVDVAQQTGTLLFRKDGGDHVLVPALNRFVSLDVVGRGALGNNWADILGDAEGAAIASWDVHPNAAGEYLDVTGIALPGTPQPPQPPTGGITRAELDLAIATLGNTLRGEVGGLLVPVGERLDALERRPTVDPAALKAAIEAALLTYEASGNTSRAGVLPHSHTATLQLRKRQ